MSYENYVMDMATIPQDETKDKPESDDNIPVEDPESEDELKQMLGL